MFSNGWLHKIRCKFGYKNYWSLAGYLKKKTKKAISVIDDFEEALIHHASINDCIGVICGHIHTAKLEKRGELIYANCGDWIESLTALVENEDGKLELINWHCLETHHKK
jgi:UDP-2,3-diacylglucosamine pyrophosphatase LpxH